MIALMTTHGVAVAIEPDFVESVEAPQDEWRAGEMCIVRMASGKEHLIQRSYTYVTGILRKHFEARGE